MSLLPGNILYESHIKMIRPHSALGILPVFVFLFEQATNSHHYIKEIYFNYIFVIKRVLMEMKTPMACW